MTSIYEAKEKLWERIKSIMGVYGVGISFEGVDYCIVVFGRPLALMRIPNNWMGYKVRKEVVILPFQAQRKFEEIPVMALKMAEGISKLTGHDLKTVLRSKPLRKYINKLKQKVLIEK